MIYNNLKIFKYFYLVKLISYIRYLGQNIVNHFFEKVSNIFNKNNLQDNALQNNFKCNNSFNNNEYKTNNIKPIDINNLYQTNLFKPNELIKLDKEDFNKEFIENHLKNRKKEKIQY